MKSQLLVLSFASVFALSVSAQTTKTPFKKPTTAPKFDMAVCKKVEATIKPQADACLKIKEAPKRGQCFDKIGQTIQKLAPNGVCDQALNPIKKEYEGKEKSLYPNQASSLNGQQGGQQGPQGGMPQGQMQPGMKPGMPMQQGQMPQGGMQPGTKAMPQGQMPQGGMKPGMPGQTSPGAPGQMAPGTQGQQMPQGGMKPGSPGQTSPGAPGQMAPGTPGQQMPQGQQGQMQPGMKPGMPMQQGQMQPGMKPGMPMQQGQMQPGMKPGSSPMTNAIQKATKGVDPKVCSKLASTIKPKADTCLKNKDFAKRSQCFEKIGQEIQKVGPNGACDQALNPLKQEMMGKEKQMYPTQDSALK